MVTLAPGPRLSSGWSERIQGGWKKYGPSRRKSGSKSADRLRQRLRRGESRGGHGVVIKAAGVTPFYGHNIFIDI